MINFLIVSFFLFFLGLWGIVVTSKNLIIILLSLEMILLSMNLNFMVFSVFLDDILGQLFSLFILTVAAAESAMGLAILVVFYSLKGVISIDFISLMKG